MRLDSYLTEKGYFNSRTKAKQAIERGEIYISGKPITKSAFDLTNDIINCSDFFIERVCEDSFVSLGGFKLNKAIKDFGLAISGLVCADIGASTGGFTDCLLKNGASKVYSVDLNDELLDKSLKVNACVFEIIKNAKDLTKNDFNGDEINMIVCDLSFISATQVLPIFSSILSDGAKLIVLIKPQFEMDEKRKFKNGIIKEKKLRENACRKIYDCAVVNNFTPTNLTTAPIREGKNVEYLMLAIKGHFEPYNINGFDF